MQAAPHYLDVGFCVTGNKHMHTHRTKTDTIQKLGSTERQKVLSKPEKKTKVQKVPEKRGARG